VKKASHDECDAFLKIAEVSGVLLQLHPAQNNWIKMPHKGE
jgi:hypothetical protein